MSRRRLLVPEARDALQRLKSDVVTGLQTKTPNRSGERVVTMQSGPVDGGSLTTREVGNQGGPIGGEMVRRMIELAKAETNS